MRIALGEIGRKSFARSELAAAGVVSSEMSSTGPATRFTTAFVPAHLGTKFVGARGVQGSPAARHPNGRKPERSPCAGPAWPRENGRTVPIRPGRASARRSRGCSVRTSRTGQAFAGWSLAVRTSTRCVRDVGTKPARQMGCRPPRGSRQGRPSRACSDSCCAVQRASSSSSPSRMARTAAAQAIRAFGHILRAQTPSGAPPPLGQLCIWAGRSIAASTPNQVDVHCKPCRLHARREADLTFVPLVQPPPSKR